MKKKLFQKATAILAMLLVSAFIFFACSTGDDDKEKIDPAELRGKLLILQAYGPSDSNAAAATHAFIELYNNTGSTIDLSGFKLWFTDGHRTNDADFDPDADKPWKSIALEGKVANGASFLILGQKSEASSASRLQIADNYGHINDNTLTLYNRAFKIALIYGDTDLTDIQNPFTGDAKGMVDGYIDMVGAANDLTHATNPDKLLGYESTPARCSASEAVRRKDLNDTNNNSVDFISTRYASGSATSLTDEEVEVRRPRNNSAGSWDPFAEPAEPELPPEEDYSNLFVNEVSGEHKYVEIYNAGTEVVSLEGVKLERNDGESSWTGTENDSIPAGAYRLFLFNSFTPANKDNAAYPSAPANNNGDEIYTGNSTLDDKDTGLNTYAEYKGWSVGSGISDQQILKVALVDPKGDDISVFIRGDVPLGEWGDGGATRVRTHSYSRMSDGTWANAIPTPGAANGEKVSDIENPGYLTAQPN